MFCDVRVVLEVGDVVEGFVVVGGVVVDVVF